MTIAGRLRLSRFLLVAVLLNAAVGMSTISCSKTFDPTHKVSQALLFQVELRRQQIAAPTDQRLEQMNALGMITDNLTIQRVFIYTKEILTPEQEQELTEMGIKINADSWIPPLGDNPLGFFIAEMPSDKLEELTAKDYIVKLDTAEREALPRCGLY